MVISVCKGPIGVFKLKNKPSNIVELNFSSNIKTKNIIFSELKYIWTLVAPFTCLSSFPILIGESPILILCYRMLILLEPRGFPLLFSAALFFLAALCFSSTLFFSEDALS